MFRTVDAWGFVRMAVKHRHLTMTMWTFLLLSVFCVACESVRVMALIVNCMVWQNFTIINDCVSVCQNCNNTVKLLAVVRA